MISWQAAATDMGCLPARTHVSPDSGTRLVALDVIDYIAAAKRIDAKIEGRIVFQ